MKTSTLKMFAVFAAASLFASVAMACGHGYSGGYGYSSCYHSSYYPTSYYPSSYAQPVVAAQPQVVQPPAAVQQQANAGQAFEPFHSNYVVLPGDTFFEVSLKEFGTSANAPQIALFNNLQQSTALTPGQVLQLPSISANGQLSISRAPVAESLQGTANGNTVANVAPGISNVAPSISNLGSSISSVSNSLRSNIGSVPATAVAAVVEAPRPKVTVGSTLLVDGQTFGDKQGVARLNVGGAALKIEVIEWTGSSVKIRLPQLEIAGAMKADIEVVRADGSLASKTPVELGSADSVALAK